VSKQQEREDSKYWMMHSGAVPIRWMSPESLKEGLFSPKSDVWMLGVTIWEMVACRMPYEGIHNAEVMAKIINGERLGIPQGTPHYLRKVMEACWRTRPDERPTVQQLLDMLDNNHHDV